MATGLQLCVLIQVTMNAPLITRMNNP